MCDLIKGYGHGQTAQQAMSSNLDGFTDACWQLPKKKADNPFVGDYAPEMHNPLPCNMNHNLGISPLLEC